MPSSGGRRQRAVDGRQSWSIAFDLTNRSIMAHGTFGVRVRTNTAPDGSRTVSHYQNGRMTSATRHDVLGVAYPRALPMRRCCRTMATNPAPPCP